MANTLTIEETRSPVLEHLSPTVEKQVAEILKVADLTLEAEDATTLSLGFSVPMPGVRYYTYL